MIVEFVITCSLAFILIHLSSNLDYKNYSPSESLLSSAKIKAIELLPLDGPKPGELRIKNLVSRSDSNITTNSNISELKSLELWN